MLTVYKQRMASLEQSTTGHRTTCRTRGRPITLEDLVNAATHYAQRNGVTLETASQAVVAELDGDQLDHLIAEAEAVVAGE